jgi:transcriptional regulator with GAF, ATPase, and Fis domain
VGAPAREARGTPVTTDLNSMERSAIEKALLDAKHNKSKAARLLGLTRTQLYVRLRKHGLD